MSIGPKFVRANARDDSAAQNKTAQKSETMKTPLRQRMLASFMAVVMATAMTPSLAFADSGAKAAEGEASALPAAKVGLAAESVGSEGAFNSGATTENVEAPQAAAGEEPAGKATDSVAAVEASDEAGISVGVNAQQDSAEDKAAAADDGEDGIALASDVYIEDVSIQNESGKNVTLGYAPAVKVGDTVKFVATYYDEYEWDDVELTDSEYAQLTYQWYIGQNRASAHSATGYSAIEGANSRELVITSDMVGKYVLCYVTYGKWGTKDTDSLAKPVEAGEVTPSNPDAAKLAEVAKKLSTWKPVPTYGVDSNIVDMLAAKLQVLGCSDVTPSLKSVSFGGSDPAQQGGIADDGSVTYFFLSPAEKTVSYDWSILCQFKPTYTLTLGNESVEFTPSLSSTLPWDDAKVESYLSNLLDSAELTASVKSGVVESSVKEEVLPSFLYVDGKKIASLTWTSSDASAAKVTSSYDSDYNTVYKVAYTHGNGDADVQLSASAQLLVGSAPSISADRVYEMKVASKSAEDIAAEKAELEAARAQIDGKIADYADKNKAVDLSAVESDFVLPTARKIIKGNVKLSYSSSDDSVLKINGYRVIVTPDIAGGTNQATITATLTRDGVVATRDIVVNIKPIDEAEIDAAVAFMQKVKDGYAASLLGNNASVDSVSQDLNPWSTAVLQDDGTVSYSKKYEAGGLHTADLPGYDSMAGTNWRTFKSDNSSVVADETLRVTQPVADTLVTVQSSLTYEKYVALAAAHPENAKLQSLVNQPVSATFRIVGATDHSDPQISVNFQLVGVDAKGNDEVWSDGAQGVAFASTADALIEQVLNARELKHTSLTSEYGYYLSDITSADGRTLGYDAATGKYWQLFVNGKPSEVGASSVVLSPGDSVVLYYSAFGDTLDNIGKATFVSTVKIVGPDASGKDVVWAPETEVKMAAEEDMTAAALTKKVLERYGMTCDDGMWTISAEDGGTLPNGEASLGSKQDAQGNWLWWAFYINGELSNELASTYEVQPGDKIAWYFAGDGAELPKSDVETNPKADHPSVDVQFNGFANGGTGAITSGNTPVAKTDAAWSSSLLTDKERELGASSSASTPLVVDGKLYVVSASSYFDPTTQVYTSSLARLQLIDPATGAVAKQITLGSTMDSACRPIYADGIIVVPLTGCYLQAVSATTLETLWVSDAFANQSLSTLTISDGYVYLATVDSFDDSWSASAGTLRRVNLLTGAVAGSFTDDTAGYYWAGGVIVGDYYVVADDMGGVSVFSADLSRKASSLAASSAGFRSTLVVDGDNIYAVSKDGVLHRFAVDAAGNLSETGKVQFAGYSTSTPTISGGYAFVGGSDDYKGVLACIKLSDLSVTKVTKADGELLPFESKSTPLVSMRNGKTYVYFTLNGAQGDWPNYTSGGGVYAYCLGDEQAKLIFAPGVGFAQYCMASIVSDGAGNLYYTNDSGYLFKVAAQEGEATEPVMPTDPKPVPDVEPGQGSAAGSGGDNNGSQLGGYVAPAATPIDDADGVNAGKAEGSDDVATPRSAAGGEEGIMPISMDDGADQPVKGGTSLPFVLLGVGGLGLAGAAAWMIGARRRNFGR